MLYLFAVVYGFAYGGTAPSQAGLVGETFRLGKIGAIFGGLDIGFGVGAAIGPVIGGLIFDFSNSYFMAFLYLVAVLLTVAVLTALVGRETDRIFR